MSDEKLTFDDPHDPATELCNVGLEAMKDASEDSDRLVTMVMRRDGDKARYGLAIDGYEDPSELLTDLLLQLRAIAKLSGKQVLIAPLRQG